MSGFTIRIDDEDLLHQFDALTTGQSRQEKIEELMRSYVASGGNQYFTLQGFSEDGTKKAELHYTAGKVRAGDAIGLDEREQNIIEHAEMRLRRGKADDFTRAEQLFASVFGEMNVYRRDDTQL